MSPTPNTPATRCQVPQFVSLFFSAETLQPLNSLAFLRDRFRYRPSGAIRGVSWIHSHTEGNHTFRFGLVFLEAKPAKSPRFLGLAFSCAFPPQLPPQNIHQRIRAFWSVVQPRLRGPVRCGSWSGRIRTAACRMFTQSTHLKTYTP